MRTKAWLPFCERDDKHCCQVMGSKGGALAPPLVCDNVDECRELLVVNLMGVGGEDINGMYSLVGLAIMGDIVVVGGKRSW